jgi:hypothetical protein
MSCFAAFEAARVLSRAGRLPRSRRLLLQRTVKRLAFFLSVSQANPHC